MCLNACPFCLPALARQVQRVCLSLEWQEQMLEFGLPDLALSVVIILCDARHGGLSLALQFQPSCCQDSCMCAWQDRHVHFYGQDRHVHLHVALFSILLVAYIQHTCSGHGRVVFAKPDCLSP